MSNISSAFILQILAIALGGGTVQLCIFLLRRRSELRKLNTDSDATISTSYKEQVASYKEQVLQLKDDGTTYREQLRDLQAKVDRLETRHVQAQRDFTSQLNDAQAENTRLTTQVARLHTDLGIANRQVAELERQLGTP